MATADELLIERAKLDFEEGLAHARSRVRASHGRIVGATLDALITTAVAALSVRQRMAGDVAHLIDIARRSRKGEDARVLAAEHLDHLLRLKRGMNLVAREDDPEFLYVRELALDLMEARLPDLARMAEVDGAADYPDLVRRAFPDRAHVDAIVVDNARRVGAILDHLSKHPHVLRMPASMAPKIEASAREFLAWKVADVQKGVDAIYGTGGRAASET